MTIEQQPDLASGSNRQSNIGNHQFIEVSAALIFRNGKLLIAQRQANAHLGGLWEFPGGKREAGETFEQCLAREIQEELGVKISVGELFETITHSYPEKTVHLKFFICRLVEGEPRPIECSAILWVNKMELTHYPFPAADVQLLKRLNDPDEMEKLGWI